MSGTELQIDLSVNGGKLQTLVPELYTVVYPAVDHSWSSIRNVARNGNLPKFQHDDFVLVPRNYFTDGDKLSLRWRGPRSFVKSLNDYVYEIED